MTEMFEDKLKRLNTHGERVQPLKLQLGGYMRCPLQVYLRLPIEMPLTVEGRGNWNLKGSFSKKLGDRQSGGVNR